MIASNPIHDRLDHILFVYAKPGKIRCYSADELRPIEATLKADGWKHTASIHAARWIETLANTEHHPIDMIDELKRIP